MKRGRRGSPAPPLLRMRVGPFAAVLTICFPSSLPVAIQRSLIGLFAVSAAASLASRSLKTQHTR